MIDKSYIEGIASHYCATEHPDYYIVEVAVHPGNRIIVELGARGGISIDACVALSKHIEGQLDREAEDFELEVGSAGDHPHRRTQGTPRGSKAQDRGRGSSPHPDG